MRHIIILILILSVTSTKSQTVKVIDAENKKPVPGVLVFDKPYTHSVSTNKLGEAPLNNFKPDAGLIFQHPSYENIQTNLKSLSKKSYQLIIEPSNLRLKEVTISANKWEQNIDEVPNQIAIITGREIQFGNPQTSADLLNNSEQVFVQKSQLGGGSPMIRGFASNSVLIVVDGVRMNNAIFRGGNLQNVINIDPNFVENSEVIFGPGSIIYGSDALGGVMDFHTLSPRLSAQDTLSFSGNAMMRFASANNENTLHAQINGGSRKWAFRTGITHSKFGDLKMGRENNRNHYQRNFYVEQINGKDALIRSDNPYLQNQSGYRQMNFMQKIRFQPNENIDLNYNFNLSTTSNIPRYDRLIQKSNQDNIADTLKYAEWYYGPQEWIMNNVRFKHSRENLLYDQLKLTLAHQRFKESRHKRKFNEAIKSEQYEKVMAYTANIDAEKYLGKHELFYGAQYVLNNVESRAHNLNISNMTTVPDQTRYPNGKNIYQTLAAYGSYKHVFSNTLYGTTGIRYSHVLLDASVENNLMNLPVTNFTINTGALTGSLGLVKKIPAPQLRIATNLSSGFRAPNLDDIAKVFDSEPGTVIVPNANLEPEYAYNADLSIQKKVQNRAYIKLTGFYTLLNNAIVRRQYAINGKDSIVYDGQLSEIKANVNAGEATIYGLSASAKISILKHFSAKGHLTWSTGEDNEGEPLRHVAPLFCSMHLIYENQKIKTDLFGRYNGKIKATALAPSERSKTHMYALNSNGEAFSPEWYTINIRVQYQLNKNIVVNGAVENIFDFQYRPYSSGIVAPGRNFVVSGRYLF